MPRAQRGSSHLMQALSWLGDYGASRSTAHSCSRLRSSVGAKAMRAQRDAGCSRHSGWRSPADRRVADYVAQGGNRRPSPVRAPRFGRGAGARRNGFGILLPERPCLFGGARRGELVAGPWSSGARAGDHAGARGGRIPGVARHACSERRARGPCHRGSGGGGERPFAALPMRRPARP